MNSKIYACIFSVVYVALIVVALLLVVFEPRPMAMQQHDVMYIEFIEPESPPEPPKVVRETPKVAPPVPNSRQKETPPHEVPAPEEITQQSSGPAEETRTVKQRALLQMPTVGTDKPADVGNEMAKQDTVASATGKGQGLSQYGDVAAKVDAGLQGRGCDYLPRPSYPSGYKYGKVVVRVIVNTEGKVVSAVPTAEGGGTSDAELWNAAQKAALKARFKPIEGLGDQGGTITYEFNLK